ncbi:cytochrome P450 [Streptomyces camponoticapitis]|uniref:Cytochrome P450 n=1 Tax=Streptomyces camponoticapitis TaxID=1616125 RepID=A0ABQ2ETJ6_9ACTN|nr:cytochrome P450 [Streptomyces camponoticapitis]GGK25011.1 cytochrome P450 [Streptomyces camponoticapitis]
MVTDYEEARSVLSDPRMSKRSEAAGLEPGWLMSGIRVPEQPPWLITLDAPEHTRLRRLAGRAFIPRQVEALRPAIQRTADRLLDDMLATGSQADLVDAFAFPLPALVICELLGVPAEDIPGFRSWTDVVTRSDAPELQQRAFIELSTYLGSLIGRKRDEPGDDLLSALAQPSDEETPHDRPLDDAELVGVVLVLLVAGLETTGSLIGNAVLELLRRPELAASLRTDPDLMPDAVEEFLRFNGPAHATTERFATQDLTIGSLPIRRGDMVLVSLSAANRDPSRFSDADDLRIGRDTAGHMAFGHGPHYCLGAPLARAEAVVALNALLQRVPDLRLAVPENELTWRPGLLIHGPAILPVCFDAMSGSPAAK